MFKNFSVTSLSQSQLTEFKKVFAENSNMNEEGIRHIGVAGATIFLFLQDIYEYALNFPINKEEEKTVGELEKPKTEDLYEKNNVVNEKNNGIESLENAKAREDMWNDVVQKVSHFDKRMVDEIRCLKNPPNAIRIVTNCLSILILNQAPKTSSKVHIL